MSLADQIRDLADRVQEGLRISWDFYDHTSASWEATKEFAQAGHAVNIRARETGATLGAADVDLMAQRYVKVNLAEAVFKDLASLLEDWVFGLLELWLLAYPKGIPNKERKPVPLADLLEATDLDALIRDVVRREVLSIAYKRPDDWFEYLDNRVDLGCPTADRIQDLAEIKVSRDVLVHNRGIVNKAYLEKTGDRARFTEGDRLDVPEPYLLASLRLVQGVIGDMAASAIKGDVVHLPALENAVVRPTPRRSPSVQVRV
jgi:hypothetical protein